MHVSADPSVRLVKFWQGRASKFGSKYVTLLATRASADPIVEVKQTIKVHWVELLQGHACKSGTHASADSIVEVKQMLKGMLG